MFFYFLQLNMRIIDILTKSYKITIDCFKPTISVGSTLTHVRYYLDDPVHLLVSGTSCEKCDLQFRAPSFWCRCRGLFEFGQLTVYFVA